MTQTFVVRLLVEDKEPEFKAFRFLSDARAFFGPLWKPTFFDSEYISVALFEVTGVEDVREAVNAVKRGDQRCVSLIDIIEPVEVDIQKKIDQGLFDP